MMLKSRQRSAERLERIARWLQPRIADRLGSDGNGLHGSLWTMPDKPKGMHWDTYERFLSRIGENDYDFLALLAVDINRFQRELECQS